MVNFVLLMSTPLTPFMCSSVRLRPDQFVEVDSISAERDLMSR